MTSSNRKDELISMEEGRLNIIVNRVRHEKESGQPSNKNILCESLRYKLKYLKNARSEDKQENDRGPKIQRASYMLRRDEKIEKHFEPRMVSVGPFHHGDKFKLAEKLKLKLAAHFIEKHHLDEVDLYNKINGNIESLRKCYFEEEIKNFNNDDLAWMFLVDGCALIHYIDYASKDQLEVLKIKSDMKAFAQQDLFLLENQLPYQVIDLLITSIEDQVAVRNSIIKFIDHNVRNIRCQPASVGVNASTSTSVQQPPAHLLELLWRSLVGPNEPPQYPKSYSDKSGLFRNVNELKTAWIQFKSEKEGYLRNVSFDSDWFTGNLKLPSLAVDDSTEPKFLNLIAFEMCPDFENHFPVSSYISFLDSLIDQADDVKDLRKANILHNALGSDERVARLFNEISIDVVPNLQTYLKVNNDIQRHFNKKWNTWMAQAYHNHFSSPWSFIAFVAAILALVMISVQTWYTVFPKKC